MPLIYNRVSAIGCIFTAISNVCLNTLLIFTWMKLPKRVKDDTGIILLMNQILANVLLIVPSVIWTYVIVSVEHSFNPIAYYCMVISFYYSNVAMILSLLVTSTEKFLSMAFPLHHFKMTKKGKIITSLVVIWVLPLIPAVSSVLIRLYLSYSVSLRQFVQAVISILLFLICVIFAQLVYSFNKIRSVNHQQLAALSNVPLEERSEEQIAKVRRNDRKLIIGMICIAITYLVTILPEYIVNLLCHNYDLFDLDFSICYWTPISFLVYTLYPSGNALLIMFFKDEFKRARRWLDFKNCFSKQIDYDVSESTMSCIDEDANV